jgi:ADP-ribose pyrophosphatase YjhB (NUDIX family)
MAELVLWQKAIRQGQRIAGLFRRPMTLGVRAIAQDEAGRVFLVRHTYVPGFHLPGGGVEPGETAVQSLLRELEEEGGLTADTTPSLIGFYFNPRHSGRDHVALYHVPGVRQAAPRPPDWEIAECGFYSLDSLPEDVTASTKARIAEFFQTKQPAHIW